MARKKSKDIWAIKGFHLMIAPKEDELLKIQNAYKIPERFLTDPLDPEERARIEVDEGALLVIIRVPVKIRHLEYRAVPLGIIFKSNELFIISPHPSQVSGVIESWADYITSIDFKSFVLRVFSRTVIAFLQTLREVNERVDRYEKELHKSMRNQELFSLLAMEKSLVHLTTSLKSNEILLEKIVKTKLFLWGSEEKEALEDIIIDNRQAMEMAKTYTDILVGTMDAFASIISNNLNIVMKTLTSLTVVLMLPTLVASFYGMNVHLPLQNNPMAFFYLFWGSVGASVLMIFLFRKFGLF